jgi:spermidine synthase
MGDTAGHKAVTQRVAVPLLAQPSVRLFLTSAVVLCAELLLIRWIPSKIIYVGLFNNFILMASFLGIGLGILSTRGSWRPRIDPAPLLLFLLTAVVISGRLNVALPSTDQVFIGAAPPALVDVNVGVLAAVIVLTTLAMAALARPLGPLFRELPPLRAYATDIAGALFGIALFAALSAFETQPPVWFGVLSVLLILLALGTRIDRGAAVGATAVVCMLALALFDQGQGLDRWSSYYRLSLYPGPDGFVELSVNGIPYQNMVKADVAPAYFSEVYRSYPSKTFRNALIIGAGTGNDTAAALRGGVGSIDSVDIDPAILRIGLEQHPDGPYDDPRVHRYVDDGRAFLRRSTNTYDLIVFAQTDSFVLVGNSANVRLESFLFTKEAFESAKAHLAPDGVLVLYNAYRERWLIDRYASTLREVFTLEPVVRTYPQFGSAYRAWLAVSTTPAARPGDSASAESLAPALDDWPFPYLHDRAIAPRYLIALGLMLVFAGVAVMLTRIGSGVRQMSFSPHFFVLGAAFLLLETRSLVTFSLLFGTTWTVNALAFFGILVVVLAAIAVNARFRIRRAWPIYAAIFGALGLNALIPATALLFDPPWLRYGVAAALVFAPIFFANVAFSHSFKNSAAADGAFASNLIGAMFGGILEWSALVTGYQSLLAVAAVLYLAAYLLSTRWRTFADRDLATQQA